MGCTEIVVKCVNIHNLGFLKLLIHETSQQFYHLKVGNPIFDLQIREWSEVGANFGVVGKPTSTFLIAVH